MNINKLIFLGTGTSQGVPIIGCKCDVCKSTDPKDKRFRSSVYIEYQGIKILIDAGPDFRSQMLRENLSDLDAILLTHAHKDHTGGLDDIRSLNYVHNKTANIFCEQRVLESLKSEYPYAFAETKYIGSPEWRITTIENKDFYIKKSYKNLIWISGEGYKEETIKEDDNPHKVKITPIRGLHGKLELLGFRIGDLAYLTDMNYIPDSEFTKLKNLKHLIISTVGYKPHHSHFCLDLALETIKRIGAENNYLSHLSHTFPKFKEFSEDLKSLCKERDLKNVSPAYDGKIIYF